jgi:hypothetical protein
LNRIANVAVFGTDVLPGDAIYHFDVSKRIKQTFSWHLSRRRKFCRSPGIRAFFVSASGKHPMALVGCLPEIDSLLCIQEAGHVEIMAASDHYIPS